MAPTNNKSPSDDRKPDKTKQPQRQGLEAPAPQAYESRRYDSDTQTQWTPEPEPYDPETYTAWGRKHFGDDWFEQRKTMLEERNCYINRDQVYEERRRTLRLMEFERQRGKLPLKGKTWQELVAWARMHYGEVWYQQRKVLDQLDRDEEEISDPEEKKKIISKWRKCDDIISDIQLDTDEAMLAEGKTWHDIMAFPVNPSNIAPSIEAGGYTIRSPSPSSDGSGYDTYPPTPTETRIEARNGPDGPEHEWGWRWELLEWRAVHRGWAEEEYEEEKLGLGASIRSSREDEDGDRRREEELDEIRKVKYLPGTLIRSGEYDDRMRKFDLRADGWTQEQIEAADRADTTAWNRRKNEMQEQIDAMLRGAAVARERWKNVTQEQLDAMDREAAAARERWKNEHPTSSILDAPFTQAERDALDARLHGGHNELTCRLFGLLEPEQGNTTDTLVSESGGVSQPRASMPQQTRDISRKTRGGRITKNTVPSQSVANTGTRCSRRATATPANALMPNRQSKQLRQAPNQPDANTAAQIPPKTRERQAKVQKLKVSDAIDDRVLQSKPHNTRQRKAYKQERGSRRLASRLPEYGMLPKRGEPAPPYEPPSNIRKPNPSGARSRASSKKKSIAVKGAKPRGISKSGGEGTNRPKGSKKGSKG